MKEELNIKKKQEQQSKRWFRNTAKQQTLQSNQEKKRCNFDTQENEHAFVEW